ncbi:toxin glutamine deamidase domain-containing protein [Micromonospora echinaurantiaca]|uniref:toxin glutamine deamidase domain-containing protein n=1 Tax=Micromonospora echinaurantiaca TaxID=47857 RepID=UPI0037B9DE47
MSLLPSPVPHPLDHSPWELPGWVYEALDWVVGVEWPEGNEQAVWDLADQWYAVAAALAGPRADAIAAATEVRDGYGGVGAVAAAFDTAWRRMAEGDDAPLPVLLAISADLGRLVEECGCDIEAAKLEVWIELGILVVELLSLAVATVLTAGAASPAAGAAITASRLIVQRIFQRLMGQLARKSLRHGLKEAGERAAKEVTRDGARGLARRAALGGLAEAGEEAGVNLATQAYQNSTGRRHGLDVADLGTSAVGGLAGGAVAPLAGLGRHASGRGAQVGEHVTREMAGGVLAEQAASLATGQGPTSLEDAARAAVSGARGSLTGQTDAALRSRLDGQLSVLAGVSGQGIGDLPTPAVQLGAESSTSGGEPVTSVGSVTSAGSEASAGSAASADSAVPAALAAPVAERVVPAQPGAPGVETLSAPAAAEASRSGDPDRQPANLANSAEQSHQPAGTPGGGLGTPTPIGTSADGSGDSTSSPTLSTVDSAPPALRPTLPAEAGAPIPASPAPTAAGALIGGSVPTVADAAIGGGVPATGGGTAGVPASTTPGGEAGPPSPPRAGAAATAPPGAGSVDQRPAPSARFPLLDALAPVRPPTRAGATAPERGGPPPPAPVNRYAEQWAIDREAFERRRYRGYYESQRAWFEENRRRDEAARLRARAEEHHQRARDYTIQARRLDRAGQPYLARTWQRYADDETRAYGECQDLADEVLAGTAVPSVVGVHDPSDFRRINDDVGDLAVGAVETADRSALTGDDDPPPIDRSRRYGLPGGLRPPLALHQTDVERRVPREPDGSVTRTADPRRGDWFRLLNDGGPAADPTRGINCLDCTLSLFDTWMHGRPRVSAPRTFDAYQAGDVTRPLDGERDGVGRIEDVTGGRFQRLCQPGSAMTAGERRHAMETGYRNLHDQLLLGGHGSFAFVINSWEQGGSHIWVALNQHGTVLYLDPQTGRIADQPLYRHSGAPHPRNAVDADILVLGPDGRPMPMAGLRRGRFSARPDLPEYPPAVDDEGYGEPYVNRMHLLDSPGSVPAGDGRHDASDHGGSDPGDGQFPLSAAERAALSTVRDRAVAEADDVEAALDMVGLRVTEDLQLPSPVQLTDQGFRIKSFESLARKYLDEAQIVGVPVEDFVREVNDVLRFSFSMPSRERYRDAVVAVLDQLTRLGFRVEECKNFWKLGNRFYGFNCTLTSPGGFTFELQLHTEASRDVWLRTHRAYEVLRRTSELPERRVRAFLQMLAANRSSGIPGEMPPDLHEQFPAKDASFAKWILVNGTLWREYRRYLDARRRTFGKIVAEYRLASDDFPITRELAMKLERSDVDLLRRLPD